MQAHNQVFLRGKGCKEKKDGLGFFTPQGHFKTIKTTPHHKSMTITPPTP